MIRIATLLPTTFTFPKTAAPEVWRQVPSLDGYSASSRGYLRNDESGRFVRGAVRPDGYRHSTFDGRDGRRRTYLIHRLVAEAFHGACPPGLEVDHLNSDRGDNRSANLAYCSHRENLRRSSARGKLARGDQNPRSKLTPEAARELRAADVALGDLTRFAKRYGVSVPAVRAVRLGKTWAWVS